ncbi:13186_t:CDS:2 [Gigaspora rosea]|nr:13186_t:CDS:2 [Gigaspora rosea]
MPLSFNDGEFQILVDELVAGVDAALYSLKTWLGMWVHLPLGICRLGDDNEQEFVFTYAKVIFKMPWNSNAQIQYYIQEHEYDTDSEPIHNYRLLYEFVKCHKGFQQFYLKAIQIYLMKQKKAKLTFSTVNIKNTSVSEMDLRAARSQRKSIAKKNCRRINRIWKNTC